jgi:hypothetical protein
MPVYYGYDMTLKLSKALVMGVKSQPNSVFVNNVQTKDYEYNQSIQLLSVNNISAKLSQKVSIEWK